MAFSRPIATLLQTHFGGRPTLLPGRCARLLVPASSQLYSTFVDKRLYLETHPDEKNIENPYNVGATFLATSHNPSSNTCRAFPRPTDHLRERIRTRHPAELCLEYLPDPGTPGDRQLHLTITEQLQVGECENSQVVTARPLAVQGQPLPFNVARDAVVAAKFYDPARLGPLQGIVVPRFYGSYTVDIPVPQAALQHHHAQPRLVRLVLYEYINGTQLSSAEARLFSTKQRQAIVQKVLNSFSKMRQLGVYHLDFHPGNIVVLSAEEGQEADIRCIDFGHSKLSDPSYVKLTLDPESRESVTEYWRDEDLCDCMLDFSVSTPL
ncbi:hypothetical protein BBAD15_g6996 [Beauveria bassiana D1-5]|uniref:Protein kinase domain-containing protein n=1 Tax=Beauveria bassiana D1-5 TaxID=1245745 RepID=A0A0A2VIL0_BEABA|nr:hypothetical protein BBAD15_g6996 [Beauveria bassiana D1-5]